MKKSLLSILTASLLVVGCQDYDDQFSSLESQISALATTVAGLSQVQSDLASLAGTVGSLATTVNGLGDQIDTAVSDGLTDIQEDIDAINTAVADVASSDDVAALQDAVDASQDDLDDLLAASSVFSGNVVINSPSTLDVYEKMGPALNIVNGSVSITATSEMDNTKLQTVVDNILTTVGDFSYSAGSTVASVTFLNLTGTQSLTIKQAGDYRFDNLTSATNIFLDDSHKNKVKVIHFGALTSVTSFNTGTASANLIEFNKVMELHLTSLVKYPPLNLTVKIRRGAAFPQILDDVNTAGAQSNITLDINGPASFTSTTLKDGSLTFGEVVTVSVDGFEGAFTIGAGVESFSANKVTALTLTNAKDLTTLNITGALDPDVSTDKAGPAISIEDNINLDSVTLAGKVGAVTLEGNNSMTSVVISAEVDGAITIGDDTATADGNNNLTTVTLTGSKATAVEVSNNNSLEGLTIDTTFIAGTKAAAKLDGDVSVEGNPSLISLIVSSDKIENLTVIGNDDLTTLNFAGLTVAGATGSPAVYIYDNDLTGAMTDSSDGDTDVADGKTGDAGSITETAGMASLKTYLTAVTAVAKSTVKVLFDTVDFTSEAAATAEFLYVTSPEAAPKQLRVAYFLPNTAAAAVGGTKSKRTFLVDMSTFGTPSQLQITVNDVDVFDVDGDGTPANIDLTTNLNSMYIAVSDVDNIARAASAGVKMSVTKNGNAYVDFRIGATLNSTVFETTNGVASALTVLASDILTITVGGNVVSGLMANDAATATSYVSVAARVQALWAAAVTASPDLLEFSVGAIASSTIGPSSVMRFTALDRGNGGVGVTPSISVKTFATTGTAALAVIPIIRGATNSAADNASTGTDMLITFEATTAGSLLSEIGNPASSATSGTYSSGTVSLLMEKTKDGSANFPIAQLHTNYRAIAKTGLATTLDSHPDESWGDAVFAEEGTPAGASTASTYLRVAWLQ
jgi:hypothetical protein